MSTNDDDDDDDDSRQAYELKRRTCCSDNLIAFSYDGAFITLNYVETRLAQ